MGEVTQSRPEPELRGVAAGPRTFTPVSTPAVTCTTHNFPDIQHQITRGVKYKATHQHDRRAEAPELRQHVYAPREETLHDAAADGAHDRHEEPLVRDDVELAVAVPGVVDEGHACVLRDQRELDGLVYVEAAD